MTARPSPSTLPEELPDLPSERRARLARAAALTLLTAFVLAGLLGAFGVSSATVAAKDGQGLRAELTYAARARGGLAVPFELRIHRPGGFDAPIEVITDTDYLASFDENGANPAPDSSSADDDTTTWEFDPPDADTFTVWLDVRVEPGVQWRRSGTTVVRTGDEQVTVRYTTWVFP